MKPTRNELGIIVEMEDDAEFGTAVPATDDDLEQMGLVQAPECEKCEDGVIFLGDVGEEVTCPKCGGSGYGRLVPEGSIGALPAVELEGLLREEGYIRLDVDVEALREAIENFAIGHLNYLTTGNPIWKLARQVLAALDGETT